MKITKLPISRWLDYKNLYMESIANSPQAFLWSKEEIGSKKDSEWQDRMKNMFFAIADDGELVGMAGSYCEPIVPQLEHLFKSILHTYSRLKELGFTYFDGTVSIIETEGDSHD